MLRVSVESESECMRFESECCESVSVVRVSVVSECVVRVSVVGVSVL